MIEIVAYRPEHARAFYDINAAWIEEMFALEPLDRAILEGPEEHILQPGGHIVIAELDGRPVGTGALKRTGAGSYEVTKMGVLPEARGHQVGAKLLQALLRSAADRDAKQVYLLTSHKCVAAIHLYEKFGFVHDAEVLSSHGPEYSRCDVAMSYPVSALPKTDTSPTGVGTQSVEP